MNPAQAVGIVAGVWLMAAPAVLGYADSPAGDVHRTIGPVAASVAIIAVWDATRGVRLVNVLLGVVLTIAPLFVGHPAAAALNGTASGAALVAATPFGGAGSNPMAGGWQSLWRRSGTRQRNPR